LCDFVLRQRRTESRVSETQMNGYHTRGLRQARLTRTKSGIN